MALVTYADSSDDEEQVAIPPPAKKQKISKHAAREELPPLPTAFLDLYSSTVRTSTQDDPSLHGGRKRVTPHVEGYWPTHVYLEWHPQPADCEVLAGLIAAQKRAVPRQPASKQTATDNHDSIHSLLQNELGVSLPLHVSLSRPLTLKTEQRTAFLDQLREGVQSSGVRAFSAEPGSVKWHPNEVGSRHFLVLSLQRPEGDELRKLLNASNVVAKAFDQPLLYHEDDLQRAHASGRTPSSADGHEKFHISIAWSLARPSLDHGLTKLDNASGNEGGSHDAAAASQQAAATLTTDMDMSFSGVKVRIGQDVTTIPLPAARRKGLFT